LRSSTQRAQRRNLIIGGIILAISEDPTLAWVLVGVIPILAIAIAIIMRNAIPLFRIMQVKLDKLNLILDENLTGVRVTQSFARELGPMGIRVNAIAPGPTDTEATRTTVPKELIDALLASMPLARMGTPSELADACLFLLSDDARWITGHVLNVDGGQIMRV